MLTLEELLNNLSNIASVIKKLLADWYNRNDIGLYWKELIEPLAFRIKIASDSIIHLIDGTVRGKYTNNPDIFPDLSSIYTLARSLMEAYLTFYYLYIEPTSDEERDIKYKIYVVQGLSIRQATMGDIEELYQQTRDQRIPPLIQQFKQEYARITQYRLDIEASSFFNNTYSTPQKRSILSVAQPRARTKSWEKIIESSTLKTIHFQERWNLYTNHAHTEYIGLLQLRDYSLNPNAHHELLNKLVVQDCLMIASVFIKEFAVYVDLSIFYEQVPVELKDKIYYWQSFATS